MKREFEEGDKKSDEIASNKNIGPVTIAYAGHRGFGANQVQKQRNQDLKFPENSLISFQKVMESGADFIEFDLYLSLDKHLMAIHDDDLSINATYIVQKANEILRQGSQEYYQIGELIKFPPGKTFVKDFPAESLQSSFDISNGIIPPEDIDLGLYNKIPTFSEVLEVVSKENTRRDILDLPRVKLNVELKGVDTGIFVQKAIEDFNTSQVNETNKIQQHEIFYISFLDGELATIAGLIEGGKGKPVPDANLILGVPTNVQYVKVTEQNYEIEDKTLNYIELKRVVEHLHEALQKLPEREGKGLTGVDVSMWDVGDESITYFCSKLKVPIHLAVVPFDSNDFVKDEIRVALFNITKIVNAQSTFLSNEMIIIKTDNPALLKEIVEKQSKEKTNPIIKASIMRSEKGSSLEKVHEPIKLFTKPGAKKIPVEKEEAIEKAKKIGKTLETATNSNIVSTNGEKNITNKSKNSDSSKGR